VRYPRKLPVYDTEEGIALLHALAQQRSISAAAVLRQLVREEAHRIGLQLAAPLGATDEEMESNESATEETV
jgi:hypothetical protein